MMGSGNRFQLHRGESFGLGFYVARFPFAFTLGVQVAVWSISIGLGKGYDQ